MCRLWANRQVSQNIQIRISNNEHNIICLYSIEWQCKTHFDRYYIIIRRSTKKRKKTTTTTTTTLKTTNKCVKLTAPVVTLKSFAENRSGGLIIMHIMSCEGRLLYRAVEVSGVFFLFFRLHYYNCLARNPEAARTQYDSSILYNNVIYYRVCHVVVVASGLYDGDTLH